MKLPRCLRAGLLTALPLFASFAFADDQPVGEFAGHGDVGAPEIAGNTTYHAGRQEYTLTAGGTNMWGATDQFQFAWKKLKGDFILFARVEFTGQGVIAHRKMGWIVRSSLEADATYADACVHGDGLTSLQSRKVKGGISEQKVLPITGGDVIKFERRGQTYLFSSARYGEAFVTETLDLDLGDEVYAGLFLCSHSAKVKEEAIFKEVRIVIPPKQGYVPYRDYIGANLEVLNIATGRREIVYSSPEQFEAPNWKLDHKTLIVNVSAPGPNRGQLKTFDLATKQLGALDTGTIGRNNNDHVLSFDGKVLGVSIHTPDAGNRSVVYRLPVTGGAPVRITKNAPSYFHGWSPDGKWMVFTGGRKFTPDDKVDKYDIYKIAADGSGEEIRLTSTPGRSDGPEFTPDGQWIYYNSTQGGLMQIWRMRPDGSGQEQVTNDGFNNWFPHISPDGKWIVFISYGTEVKPEDHPYHQHCYLRLMPATGGPARVVAYLFGGQGTINVPSWAPDSTRLAFVSNTRME